MSAFTESVVEQAALAWLESVGWAVRNGAAIAPGEPGATVPIYYESRLAKLALDEAERPKIDPEFLPRRALRSLTSRSCRRSFWPRYVGCPSATSRWNSCRNS